MPAHPSPSAAPVVPGYVLEELLGRGGSGQVWRVRPRSGGPPVAVKVLVRGDPERQEREAGLLGELDHPHLVRLHHVVRREVRDGPAQVALVLDLLAGGSLAALLARRGRLRPGEVVTTVAPVAAALAHAHERGVVHGDLSPGNVVFTAEGRPVLTDLGTARLVGDTARAEVTPAYVDPVVARGGAPGPASDVFGVAAAAFHALTGVAPWNAADPAGTLAVAAGGEIPDLALLAPEAPEELVRVVLRGLSAEPHLRGSAAAFALDLRHSCRPEPVRLPVAGVPDGELGATGQGPRTELTHQVPGRRPRAAHAVPVPDGRWAQLRGRLGDRVAAARGGSDVGVGPLVTGAVRRAATAGLVLVAVAAALAGVTWLGASWGGSSADPVPAAGRAAAGTAPPPPTAPTSPDEHADDGSASPADRSAAPVGDAEWAAVLSDLYVRRSTAFVEADPTVLAEVHASGSALLARDTEQVQQLVGAGQRLDGFAPRLVRLVEVTAQGPTRVEVQLVDALPAYRVVRAGAAEPSVVAEVPARGEAPVRLVLERAADGWRIADAVLGG
ncbi:MULTISPECIES: serine/threonine-protein kinase [unclassified Modestobacter]|uniref:serine/threonine-protein kinase n=1 Tax=unclassified Modestobacter TaxID=2643866 RepID=UPI0022AA4662|nr:MULTISPECIES: serine/threonine-protein kinase [unclassified Modestobacter]MCZ2824738.1 serine/threonine-protein kinase [Modestobacter sp. VKM Ac-2981]MCZ2854759.1 serine/threonine-protein kinase [Modestobacter sp. VKM Ac-2982]